MSESSTKQLHVLLLGDPAPGAALTRWVGEHTQVSKVDTFDEALVALRHEPFDVIIAAAADFIPLQGVHVSGQAEVILDSVTQGVCIVSESGELDFANPKMLAFPDDVRDRIVTCCLETFQWAKGAVESGEAQVRGRRFSIEIEKCGSYEAIATPVIDMHQRITEVCAVVWESTGARRLQEKIDAIDQAGRELLSLDIEQMGKLDVHERLSLIEQKILRFTKEILHFDNFVVYVIDRKSNKLEPVLVWGLTEERAATEIYATTESSGICGYVAARGRSYICPDTSRDSRYLPGIDNAQSSLSVPIFLHDEVIGVVNFESDRLAAFNEDDRQFAEIFARYIGLALHLLELLVTERRVTTGKLGSDVMTGLTGPLNDLMTETENLLEDYIGHDDLRRRLRQISDNATTMRDRLKELTSPTGGIVAFDRSAKAKIDPTLAGKRILIADDEDMIRDTVRDVLSGYGCDVRTVEDGVQAIQLIAENEFDLVLSDIKMPGKSGYEVFAAAKEANADTPVILTTGFGYDPNHTIVRARREGLAAVLFKPFKVDQLLSEIRIALGAEAT